MNMEELKQIIQQNSQSTDSGETSLTLTADALRSPTVNDLFTTYLSDQPFTLTSQQTPFETDETLILVGSSSNELFQHMVVTAQFSLIASEVALLITGKPESTWRFSTSFPALEKTFFHALVFQENSELNLSSHPISQQIGAGLSFVGDLELDHTLNFMTWLLGDPETLTLRGSITLKDEQPVFQIASPPQADPVPLGFLELQATQLELTSEVVPASQRNPAYFTTFASVLARIAIEADSGTVIIPIRADSYLNSNWIRLSADLETALESSLESLSGLANGLDPSQVLPAQLPLQDTIGLKEIALQVNLATRRLESVMFRVESKQAWTLIKDAISIEKLQFNFRLDDPMKTKRLSVMVLGEFGIG